jgi:alpha-ketoglutarate-dependent taurine dioxygenase
MAAAKKFFEQAKMVTGITPDRVTTDGHDRYPRAIRTVLGADVRHRDDRGRRDVRDEDMEKFGRPVVHPMVRTHPVHHSRALYFHPTKTMHIEGMTPEDSKIFIDELVSRIIRQKIVYTHTWRKGDMFVIDDRATMHRAHGDYDRSQSRVLRRIIVEGDRPELLAD